MTACWAWIGGTVSMVGFTLIVTALAAYGFAGLVR